MIKHHDFLKNSSGTCPNASRISFLGYQPYNVSNVKWCFLLFFFFFKLERFLRPWQFPVQCGSNLKPGGFSCLECKNECKAYSVCRKEPLLHKNLKGSPLLQDMPLYIHSVQVKAGIAPLVKAHFLAKQFNFMERRTTCMKILLEKSSVYSSGIWQESIRFE